MDFSVFRDAPDPTTLYISYPVVSGSLHFTAHIICYLVIGNELQRAETAGLNYKRRLSHEGAFVTVSYMSNICRSGIMFSGTEAANYSEGGTRQMVNRL